MMDDMPTPPPPDLNRRVAQEIRAEAARQGLTFGDLAERMSRSRFWVSARLSTNVAQIAPLDLHDVALFAEVLNVDPGVLLAAAVAAA